MSSGRKHHFERHRTEDPDLERIQDNIARTVEQINRRVVVTVAMPAASTVTVKHPLGHVPTLWRAVRVREGQLQAYESASDDKTITFTSSSACVADIQME